MTKQSSLPGNIAYHFNTLGNNDNEWVKIIILEQAFTINTQKRNQFAWKMFDAFCEMDDRRVYSLQLEDNYLPMNRWMVDTFGDRPQNNSISQDFEIKKQKESISISNPIGQPGNGIQTEVVIPINTITQVDQIVDLIQPDPFNPSNNLNKDGEDHPKIYFESSPIISKNNEEDLPRHRIKEKRKRKVKPKVITKYITVVKSKKYFNKHYKEVDVLLKKFKLKEALDKVASKYNFNRGGFEKQYYKKWLAPKDVKPINTLKGEQ